MENFCKKILLIPVFILRIGKSTMKRAEKLKQLETWFDRELDRLYNYVLYRVTDPAAAEEILSQAAELGVKRLDQYDPQKGSFAAWMFGITRNCLRDWLRARARQADPLSLDRLPAVAAAGESPEDQAEQAERFRQVIGQLSRLSENEREAVALRYGGGLKYPEIAGLMEISVDHVGVLLHRALEKLAQASTDEMEVFNGTQGKTERAGD